MVLETTVLDWLLDSDPALRWQVERDLAGEPQEVWRATRARVATEGIGARLLAHQERDGQWAGGSFFPKGFFGSAEQDEPGQPWVATTWSLNALREWGLDASALADTAERLQANSRWDYNGLPYWDGEVDVCINSFTLGNGAWLGADVSKLVAWFPEHRMPDGGWNCEAEEGSGSTRSSVHSTLNAVRGILDYERRTGDTRMREARRTGEEYLLERRLLRRLSTGEDVVPGVRTLAYPFRHHYTVLRATDHFRRLSLHEGAAPDPRIAEAVEVIRGRRREDGTFLQEARYPGRVWFEVDVPIGEPSKWVTFYATRVLDWWDGLN
ncbi:MAG TPA: squalene cyclase [Lacisediminihabitans sp.]|uniref:squalene cyclase n=1 Tax=Lacisediminihabitans sp. TaxID=2787631 RepID=UPI002ED796D8